MVTKVKSNMITHKKSDNSITGLSELLNTLILDKVTFTSTEDFADGVTTLGTLSDADVLALQTAGTPIETIGFYPGSTTGSAKYKFLNLADSTAQGYVTGYSRFQIRALDVYACLVVEGGTVDVRQYGVSKSNSDNSEAIAACFNAAKGGAFKITAYEDVTYNYQNDVIINNAKLFDIEGSATFHGENAGIYIKGALEELGTVNSAASKGDNEIELTDVGSCASGDIVILWNSTPSSLSVHRSNYYDGEFVVVGDVDGNIITFESSLETSYTASTSNIAYKLDPVVAAVKGVSFTGGSLYTFQLFAGAYSNISPNLVRGDGASTSASLSISRCYQTAVYPKRIKKVFSNQGTDYGVSISNSQTIRIIGGDIHGARHAVATGGDAVAGAVPCRDILVLNSTLKNDTTALTHTADFHGNTIDSYYINCTIQGWVGVSGRNCGVRGGRVIPIKNQTLRPLQWVEVVGGNIEFSGVNVVMPTGNVAMAGANSSITMQSVEEDFKILIDNVDLEILPTNTSVAIIVAGNYADGSLVDWSVQATNIRVTGDVSSLDRFISLDMNNAGGFVTPPKPLKSLFIDDITMDTTGLSFWVVNGGSSVSTGTIVTLPKMEKSANVTIPNGGYISSNALTFNFPSYIISPNITAMTDGGNVVGGTWVTTICTGSTATSATVFLGTMHTSETVSVEVNNRISARVGFDGFVWP